jgi:NAD(P)-dependent dehydrogenase (short-subunit alcohol dehydrogenase family)
MDCRFDYSGRHVFVFGGTTGINFGVALCFGRAGADVSVASRKQDNVDRAVAELRAEGIRAQGVTADVRDFDAVGQAFDRAAAAFGPIDVLVSGAAGNFLAGINDLSSNGFKVVVDIDLNGTFHVMRQAHRHLRKPGGSIVNITAPQSVIPIRRQSHVGAAKAGIDQLTRIAALEWGADGIRVNAISPGPIDGTEGLKRLSATDSGRDVATTVPIGRLGRPDDIGRLAMFLGSEAASFVSGAIIPCDGGGAIESVKPMIDGAPQLAS